MDIKNLENDLIFTIKNYLDNNNIKYKKSITSLNDYVLTWFEICNKRIISKPRKVIYSKELSEKINSNKIDEKTKNLIEKFKNKFIVGENINPYLSKNISKVRSIDYLLNVWRIHHLHLTDDSVVLNQMSERSDKYILFIIYDDIVFFLDQTKHLTGKEFASKHFLEILKNNNLLEKVGITVAERIININYEVENDDELYKLWKGNINLITFKINNTIYQNINATTLSSNNFLSMQQVCNLNKCLFNQIKDKELVYDHIEFDEDKLKINIYCKKNEKIFLMMTIDGE